MRKGIDVETHVLFKNIIIGISCFIIFYKFIDIKRWSIQYNVSFAVIVALIAFHNTMLAVNFYELYTSIATLILINSIIFKIMKLKFTNVLTFLVISYAGSLMILLVSSTIVSFIYMLAFDNNTPIIYMVYLSGIIQLIITMIFHFIKFKFKISNFKNFRGVCFAVFGMMLNIYALTRIINAVSKGIQISGYQENGFMWIVSACLIAYGLFTILKRETLQAYSDTALNHRLNEITAQFNSIMQTNDFLENRVHKDKKYLKAFQYSVLMLFRDSPNTETKLKAQRLLDDITEYRQSLQIEQDKHFKDYRYDLSGMVLLDSIFLYMLDQAYHKSIELEVIFNEVPDHCTEFITQEQLSTLIADLLENSIIAVESSPKMIKRISCAICKDDDTGKYQIVVKDSGHAFDKNVLDNFGKKKVTTRKESGGSGTGLWNLYRTMRFAKASFIIDESTQGADYTKTIIFRFDGRCEYKYESAGAGSSSGDKLELSDGLLSALPCLTHGRTLL